MLYPIYQGSYERRTPREQGGSGPEGVAYRDEIIMIVKDLSRSIDYLKSRTDIAPDQLAYFGFSYGAMLGPVFLAVEERLKTAVLRDGGLPYSKMRP